MTGMPPLHTHPRGSSLLCLGVALAGHWTARNRRNVLGTAGSSPWKEATVAWDTRSRAESETRPGLKGPGHRPPICPCVLLKIPWDLYRRHQRDAGPLGSNGVIFFTIPGLWCLSFCTLQAPRALHCGRVPKPFGQESLLLQKGRFPVQESRM